jgi:hypothetical protein
MDTVLRSMKSWNQSLSDVTRLCLAATTGCFLVGGAFLLADYFVPLAPRGIALLAVGAFFFAHGVFEFAKHRWFATSVALARRAPAHSAKKLLANHATSEPNEHAAA